MQKIWMYVGILVGVFILSDILIAVGLNSNYKDIERKSENSQIIVYQAEATYVNGRIRGIIENPSEIDGKYLKVELYSKRDVSLGKKYIDINKSEEKTQAFEVLFKAKDVSYYKIEPVNEKEVNNKEFEIIPKELTKKEIIVASIFAFLIFWA